VPAPFGERQERAGAGKTKMTAGLKKQSKLRCFTVQQPEVSHGAAFVFVELGPAPALGTDFARHWSGISDYVRVARWPGAAVGGPARFVSDRSQSGCDSA
jgi:hypothetical protein